MPNNPSIFTTSRLEIKQLKSTDKDYFIELLTTTEIIELIPQPKPPISKVLNMFNEFCSYETSALKAERMVWGIYETGNNDLIGLCGLLTNDENQREIAYRFRIPFWGKGYGTEVAKHTINYCFNQLSLPVIAADVWIENIGSVSILEKFFKRVREFQNDNDNCTDRRYILTREDWLKQSLAS
jgi:RimJ/RimL family protein N-acetyltransferase